MRSRRKAFGPMIAVACCLLAVLACAPIAAARLTPIVPPANGAGNEYLETLPGPGGSQPLGSQPPGSGAASQNGPSTSGASSAATSPGSAGLQTLARSGAAGRSVRDLAPRSRPSLPLAAPVTKPDSPAGSVGRLIVGKGRSGLGIALPLILGAATVAAIAFALRRRFG